ncbi:MAG: ATP-binding protein [Actinomycetota bacterium]|nr:ATP-binding protein [Actinomycetota bacterium]
MASVRVRTTVGAVVVVALALAAGAALLVLLLRDSLTDGLATTAEDRAEELAGQIETSGLPDTLGGAEDDDEVDDVVLQVTDAGGHVVVSSQTLSEPLPATDGEVELPGTGQRYVVETDDAGDGYVVSVAVSLEDVSESTAALLPLLAVGMPLVLLVVAGTTWVVVGRALGPVERIRSEVAAISDDRLDRRVPVPRGRDELHRLALTMNEMLTRLQAAHDRQQRFVSDASHELRSPLASLRQAAEVTQAHPGAMPEGELADTVLEESVRMQRIVEQMLVLTRTDEDGVRERREVDIDDLALAEAARARRDGLTVDVSGVSAGRVVGDPAGLSQVVRNLVDNAARHARSLVTLQLGESDGWVELRVDDDGNGVPADERERVFERFVRLDEARSRDAGGSGLGLAIVREIVTAHGGTASVEQSRLGGASLVVRLPA